MLRAVFLQANQAWGIMDSANNIIGIGPTNQTLFESRKELLRVLKQCWWRWPSRGNIHIKKQFARKQERGILKRGG